MIDSAKLKNSVAFALDYAKQQGADQAEVMLSHTKGLDVTARNHDVETVEFTQDKGLGITVYLGKKKANVGSSDTTQAAIRNAVDKAIEIATHIQEDKFSGLPEQQELATEFQELDLYHPWDLTFEHAIELAVDLEKRATAQDVRIKQCDSANVAAQQGTHVYGNSLGFLRDMQTTRQTLSCVLIAEENGKMQRDYWYDCKRDAKDLYTLDEIAEIAAERATQRLGAKSIKTQKVPVVFDAGMAAGLLSSFISAISGGALYRKSSFLCDHLGKQVFAPHIRIHENPFLPKGLGSCNYDAEGVRVRARDIVSDGVLQSYVLSSYSARRLGLKTTGNAGGVHNLMIDPGKYDLAGLLHTMDKGLYITELMGQGVNIITGDYSRGAAGFWVENGQIQYPVEGITIAGNLRDMFMNVKEVGSDIDDRGNIITGSLLIDGMTAAGN
jgi:PmbA protein